MWSGKAERLSFDVPTLPLFVHDRLSTEAILQTLGRHAKNQQEELNLFGDPRRPIADQVLRAYEYRDDWVNRMILGDSLVVMNSLLEYEGLGGQVQMIYIDPPYGVKFGSNFQPFVRKRAVKHNDDADMTREPEMVQAYRDTWELRLHSYLTYLRDRLLVARDLLAPTGSIFVQISDENVHHVRELMDEVFGADHFCGVINFKKTTGAGSPAIGTEVIPATVDYLLWYARDRSQVKYRQLYVPRLGEGWVNYDYVRTADGQYRRMTSEERDDWSKLPDGSRVYRRDNLTSTTAGLGASAPFEFGGRNYSPGRGGWKTSREGLRRLAEVDRLEAYGTTLSYRRFAGDFPWFRLGNLWEDTVTGGYAETRYYVVQTNSKVVNRCLLMTTDPGDLVLDPTCGSGTTAYVAEQWGRRWITVDTSRVPLALARQRLLTATFPWYELKDEPRGPAGGFVYKQKQNAKGEDVGGIVPHTTLKSIANDEPANEEILVDRPEAVKDVVRVTGPFCVEATIPAPVDFDGDGQDDAGLSAETHGSYIDRMTEVLKRSPILRLEGNRSVSLQGVRRPARSLSLSAEATTGGNGISKTVAIVFGPENGAVSERLVYEAASEAHGKKEYSHLYVIGFSIEPNARQLVEKSADAMGIPATYVQATPDLVMGDLLKNMRSSQIFSVCGLPEIGVKRVKPRDKNDPERYQVELLGVDTFDPVEMEVTSLTGGRIPAWFLDTDYNGRCFRVAQAFFPETEAWENLRKALKADFEDTVWEHLRGTTSAPFEANPDQQVAAKVIDHRGNELMVVRKIREALA
ncbi:MAG: site-specific DNA-methyltransferase [Gemmatimonadaceae bacterium]